MSENSTLSNSDHSDWENAKKVFELCISRAPEERLNFLNSQTQGNPNLRVQVLELLKYHVEDVDRVASAAPAIMQLYDNSKITSRKVEKTSSMYLLIGLVGVFFMMASGFILVTREPRFENQVSPLPAMPTQLRTGRCACLIVSEPLGASLILNGVHMGVTPQVADVTCNTALEIGLRRTGFVRFQTIRTITDPQTRIILALSKE